MTLEPARAHTRSRNVVWILGACQTGRPLDKRREGATETGSSPLDAETQPDGTILLRGELDIATIEQFERAVTRLMTPGRPVVIDMAQLTFIDSSGVAFLIRIYEATGVRVVICNPSREVRRVLELVDGQPRPVAWVTQSD